MEKLPKVTSYVNNHGETLTFTTNYDPLHKAVSVYANQPNNKL